MFLKPIFGVIYDKLGFKYSILIFNMLSLILIAFAYLVYTNCYLFCLMIGFNSLMQGGYYILLTSAAKD